MAVLGQTLFIASGSNTTPIAATKTDEIQVGCDTIEISDPTQGEWKRFINGRKEWSVTVGWLVTTNTDVQQLLNAGNSYTLKFRSKSTVYLTGQAIMTQCKITATKGSLIQGSFVFQGNGSLATS